MYRYLPHSNTDSLILVTGHKDHFLGSDDNRTLKMNQLLSGSLADNMVEGKSKWRNITNKNKTLQGK